MYISKSLIVGMGKTGHSFAEYLLANNSSFDFADTRSQPATIDEFKSAYQDKGVNFYCGDLNKVILSNYKQLLISPGVDIRHKFIQAAKRHNIAIKGDIDLFVSSVKAKIIGITGSNGKTTLTEMLSYALRNLNYRAAIGGNIGTAALTLLDKADCDIYVLELSSFQLDISKNLALDAAVVLNISEDHLDRYDSFNDYVESKASIYSNAGAKIVNMDDELCRNMFDSNEESFISFSLQDMKADAYYSSKSEKFYLYGKEVAHADQFQLQGLHNYQNILAALAIAAAIGIDGARFAESIMNFSGLPHRCELVKTVRDITWINDSKATNIGAALAAMHSFQKPLHIIMGGQAKGVDFTQFANDIPSHVKSIILFGEDADFIESFIQDKAHIEKAVDMSEAIRYAKQHAVSGDVVLLSPACASFDMYTGYEQRGNDFKRLVAEELM